MRQTSARFQLEHMGYLLQREERNDPDPRVEHFIPDTWQVCKLKLVTTMMVQAHLVPLFSPMALEANLSI